MKKAFYIFLFFFLAVIQQYNAQEITNIRQKEVLILSDSLSLDSLSIIPGSEIILFGDNQLNNKEYRINYASGFLIIENEILRGKKLTVIYRVFPLSFNQSFEHKKIISIEKEERMKKNPFLFEYTTSNEDIFYLNGLNKSGSISRGVAFGNNQDLSVNSSLNLQLSGKINNSVNILASISDDNIPIQAEGNTQQLQEFDKVFIQLFSDDWKLTAGDFYLQRPDSYFMNFNKKSQGGSFNMRFKTGKSDNQGTMRPTVSAAVSRGKFARNKIIGVEGNQGPYRLMGSENESFIVILSGTEKIYIDGKLMERGNEADYIIDYNTAEIVFTTKQLITKDKRIVAEFQYSDRNYARSLIHFGNQFENKKLKLNLNFFSEQDSKNQPLQQDLTDTEKFILSSIGDSLNKAVVPNINSVSFSENLVLYKIVDTLGIYDSVFVYSTNPDSARYQLGFSYVGPNNGNYNQIQSTANGKVYEWQIPIGGIPQGEYEPVILLATPKIRQMTSLGGEYNFSENSIVKWEGAISNNDINTFSDKDSKDNIGYAFKINSDNKIKLNKIQKNPWELNVGLDYEFVEQNFVAIERYRTVEFERDWNINNNQVFSNQHVIDVHTGIEKNNKANLRYNFSLLNNEGDYQGLKNSLRTFYNLKGFLIEGNASYLVSEGNNETNFLRHKAKISKPLGFFVVGVEEEFEQNTFFTNNSDSLRASSFEFLVWQAFVHNVDTSINKFMLTYRQREDKSPIANELGTSTLAEDVEFSFSLLKNKNHKFRNKTIYRKLRIINPIAVNIEPEENVLSRVEYVAKFFKRALSTNTYYEIGSGLEVKKEFTFIEVQPGQGTHAYIGDVNGNSVKDLNEFEVAAFQDQADFIKIFTPTNDFVRTFTNQFNQGIFLRPESIWGATKGVKKMFSRFSNRTNYRISRKVSNRDNYYNPFIGDIQDSSLVTLNLGFLNTIYFNRTGTKFGTDFTLQDNRDRSLLTNGIESRRTLNRTLKTRWNITRVYSVRILMANGIKLVNSNFFMNRNYNLNIQELEPKITIQPNTKFRMTILYNYIEKVNAKDLGGEESISQTIGSELRYNIASKGSFRGSFNYINNSFTDTDNASLEYDMLEGLQSGVNLTWEFTFQQNISKHMQLSLNYNGRKSDDTPIIHIGGVQVRAFF